MEGQLELRAGGRGLYLACGEQAAWLRERGYGVQEGECVRLSPREALYLVERGFARALRGGGEEASAEELVREGVALEEGFLTKYIVYRDLRGRGYVVREGYGGGLDMRVYGRGDYGRRDARYVVLALDEGVEASARGLLRAASRAVKLGKELIIAVVERRGDVVYYSASMFSRRRSAAEGL